MFLHQLEKSNSNSRNPKATYKYSLWIINQYANTPKLPGHTRQYEVAKGLAAKGWKVSIFASDFSLSKRIFLRLNRLDISLIEKFDDITWHWLRVSPYKKNNWKRYINMISFCIHLIIKLLPKGIYEISKGLGPDLILVSSPQLPAAFTSLLISKILKKPFVVEIRDLWPQVLIDQAGKNKNHPLIKILTWMEKRIYTEAKCVVILAKGIDSYVKERGAKKTIWLPNGPDLSHFKFKPVDEKRKDFNINDPFRILYTGAHGEANALDHVIKAANNLQHLPIHFIFLGDGPEKNKLISLGENLSNISFKDPVSKSLMPKIIASSDAILISLKDIPLFKYGVSPNKLYDAYAIGRPVISAVGGSINAEIESYKLGVCSPPENSRALSNAIEKLFLTSSIDRKKMGERARKLAERIYSRDLINSKYDELISNIVKE